LLPSVEFADFVVVVHHVAYVSELLLDLLLEQLHLVALLLLVHGEFLFKLLLDVVRLDGQLLQTVLQQGVLIAHFAEVILGCKHFGFHVRHFAVALAFQLHYFGLLVFVHVIALALHRIEFIFQVIYFVVFIHELVFEVGHEVVFLVHFVV